MTEQGVSHDVLPKEDYESHTTWHVMDDKLILPNGQEYGKEKIDEQSLYDLNRGK